MRTTIDLPESVYRQAEKVARMQGVTIEEFIVRAFERELKAAPPPFSSQKGDSAADPVERTGHAGSERLQFR